MVVAAPVRPVPFVAVRAVALVPVVVVGFRRISLPGPPGRAIVVAVPARPAVVVRGPVVIVVVSRSRTVVLVPGRRVLPIRVARRDGMPIADGASAWRRLLPAGLSRWDVMSATRVVSMLVLVPVPFATRAG